MEWPDRDIYYKVLMHYLLFQSFFNNLYILIYNYFSHDSFHFLKILMLMDFILRNDISN